LTFRRIEVQRGAALSEVVLPEIEASIWMGDIMVKRPIGPGHLTTGRLDLYDVSPEAGKELAAILSKFIGNLHDPDAGEEATRALVQ
jgi:hypothetical protein